MCVSLQGRPVGDAGPSLATTDSCPPCGSSLQVDFVSEVDSTRALDLCVGAQAGRWPHVTAKVEELFPSHGDPPRTDEATATMLETLQDAIVLLTPTDEMHRWLRSQTLMLSDNLAQTRWLLEEQAGSSIPLPFIIRVVFWLAIVFASFGLFAPLNGTAIASLCLSSIVNVSSLSTE